MKSRRGVRLPTAPPTRKHGDENRYRRNREKAQNWREYLDLTIDDYMEEMEMEYWEAQEMLDDLARADDDGMAIPYDEQREDDGHLGASDGEEVEEHQEEEVSERV